VCGCIAGAIAANGMFALSAVSIATTHRASSAHLFAEVIATLGLLLVIFSLARTRRGSLAPAAVGARVLYPQNYANAWLARRRRSALSIPVT
jgi:glycerol uptake facilitator-like aquaporin